MNSLKESFTHTKSKVLGIALGLMLAVGPSTASADTFLGIIVDASGSISTSEFNLMVGGIASALTTHVPTDSTVHIGVVQFASSAVTSVTPVLIDSVATLMGVTTTLQNRLLGGGTSIGTGITLMNQLANTAGWFTDQNDDVLYNLLTDGFSGSFQLASGIASAISLGVDGISAEAIGAGADINQLLSIVYPDPDAGLVTIANIPDPRSAGFVVAVTNFTDVEAAFDAKIQQVVAPNPNPVPEPSTMLLLGSGLVGLIGYRMKKKA